MKAMFSKLNMDDSPRDSPEGSGITGNEFGQGSGSGMSGTPIMIEQEVFPQFHPANANMGYTGMRPNDMGLELDAMSEQYAGGLEAGPWLDPADSSSVISWSTQTGFYQPPRQ